jgi:hypothetical protein
MDNFHQIQKILTLHQQLHVFDGLELFQKGIELPPKSGKAGTA